MGNDVQSVRSSEGQELPVVKINLFDKASDPVQWQGAEDFQGEPGKAYLFGHGEEQGKAIADDRNGIDHRVWMNYQSVSALLKSQGVSQDMPVVMVSCSIGRGQKSLGRELSQEFVSVEAATRPLHSEILYIPVVEWVFYNGYPDNETELRNANIADDPSGNNPGRMRLFRRDEYPACMASPESCDSPESEKPLTNQYPEQAEAFLRQVSIKSGLSTLLLTEPESDRGNWAVVFKSFYGAQEALQSHATGAQLFNAGNDKLIENFTVAIGEKGVHQFAEQLRSYPLQMSKDQDQGLALV